MAFGTIAFAKLPHDSMDVIGKTILRCSVKKLALDP